MSATSDLLSNYQHIISGVRVITGSRGTFLVTVNGAPLYNKHETGRHAEPGEVLALFTELVGNVKRYGDA